MKITKEVRGNAVVRKDRNATLPCSADDLHHRRTHVQRDESIQRG